MTRTHDRRPLGKARIDLVHALGPSLMLALLLASPPAFGESAFHEAEPNETIDTFGAISGEVTLHGTMFGPDQDGYRWTVSDDNARKLWRFELQGIPGAHTVIDVMAIEYADNGVDVVKLRRLMRMGTRDGSRPSVHEGLLFDPGDYVLGLAQAGSRQPSDDPPIFRATPPSRQDTDGSPGAARTAGVSEPGAYRFLIREQPLDVRPRTAAHDTRADARELRPGREVATYEPDSTAWYQLTFDEATAADNWELRVRAPLGRRLTAKLVDNAGEALTNGRVDDKGQLVFSNLVPSVGTWYLELETPDPGFVQSVSTRSTGARVAGTESEPNNRRERANRIDLSTPLSGQLGGTDRDDYFVFTIAPEAADGLQTLKIDSESATRLDVCLTSATWEELQCRKGKTPIVLPDLALPPGDWGLHLDGADALSYRLSLEAQGAARPGQEAEPNDVPELATGVPADLRVRGRFAGDDTDHYRFLIAGEAQRWRFQVNGDGVESIASLDGSGQVRASARAKRGQQRLRLDNLFLPPGRHLLRLTGRQGEYTLLARPLGPPPLSAPEPDSTEAPDPAPSARRASDRRAAWNPDVELEPNDENNRQRLAVGQIRTGTLPEPSDTDHYRFFVAGDDHLRLTIAPPEDGSITARVHWYGIELGVAEARQPGDAISWQGLFPPGDYTLKLEPGAVSDADYRLTLERLPRFDCPVDCEPNGSNAPVAFAAPLPPNLLLQGTTDDWRDADIYRLPIFEASAELRIRSDKPIGRLHLVRDGEPESLRFDPELPGYRATLVAGRDQRLKIDSRGLPYHLQLEFPGGELLPRAGGSAGRISLRLDNDRVAAFLSVGQRVTGEVLLENPGPEAFDLTLEGVTSDHRWTLALDRQSVSLPAGGRATVPLTLQVPADAWADHPVRISLRAITAGARQSEAWTEVAVGRDTPPVSPVLHWPIPDPLRGGFNAAWAPFGAGWTEDTPEKVRNDVLRDDLAYTSSGSSVVCCLDALFGSPDGAPAWTLDLPGDAPLPVAGVALDHFGSSNLLRAIRRATLLLSADGASFEEVLHFETLPLLTEQHFALPNPVPARFARLRIDATFESPARGVEAGEWKVILEPGHDLSAGRGFDLAAPDQGGHLVWSSTRSEASRSVLETEDRPGWVHVDRGAPVSYVVGFHRNRAAQLDRVEWQISPSVASDENRFERVEAFASVETPVGPWRPLGTLEPGRSPGSLVRDLAAPVWARFVRFVGHPDPATGRSREPSLLQVWERPTDDGYRSALTEWGEAGSRAFYEEQRGLPVASRPPSDHGSRDRAAPLPLGVLTSGTVALGRNQDWYRLRVPGDANRLRFELAGEPTLRTLLELEDSAGNALRLKRVRSGSSPRLQVYEALVAPGQDVWARVSEPPRNVILSWDTSSSVGPYIPRINNAVVAFSGEVVAQREWVNLMPFGIGKLLQRWTDQPGVLQGVLNDYRRERESSDAETTLHTAARALAPRVGTKAVVLVTDARTPFSGDLWAGLAEAQPRVFGIGVGGTGRTEQSRFRDWAAVNGGDFRQLRYLGEMEVAFDRATTLMHRPARYTLVATSDYREAPGPGRLTVVAGDDASWGGAAVELILDASGSMLQRVEGRRRIEVAKEVLIEAVSEQLPPGTPLALRVFGHRQADSCRTDLEIPLGPLDPAAAAGTIAGIGAMNLARTPIADSLAAVEGDLEGAKSGVIVLVTDGKETCGGDPAKVIESLRQKGLDVTLNIVGFAIDNEDLAARFRAWAELGGGRYLSANGREDLGQAIQGALRTPFTVYDEGGTDVAVGQVGGQAVELDEGFYRVVVGGATPAVFDSVEVGGGDSVRLSLTR